MYNMVAYKFKVVHVEDDRLNLPPIRHNRDDYPTKEQKTIGDGYGMVPLYDEHL